MNRRLSDKQEKMNVIDMDRIDVIHKIHENSKSKDFEKLDKLFERLR